MLYPTHTPRTPEQQSAADAARLHHNRQMATHSAAQRQAHYLANPDFDPQLLKPVAIQPPPPMHPAERQQIESELSCLRRELAIIQDGIAYRITLLGL